MLNPQTRLNYTTNKNTRFRGSLEAKQTQCGQENMLTTNSK